MAKLKSDILSSDLGLEGIIHQDKLSYNQLIDVINHKSDGASLEKKLKL